jgi:3',5'-cyclic AMP phosphodiesterase CpdA
MMRRLPAVAAAAALLAAGCGDGARPADGPAPGPTTLTRTLTDPDGDGALNAGPGEPLLDRTELAPRRRPGRALATWAQITDSHVRDEESPSRTPFLDRYGEPFETTFRPHEALSGQVLAAAVRAVNAQRPQAVLVTGDVTDNAQIGELRLATRVLDGGRADPDSGGGGYRGVQQADNPDPFYYRPGVDPPRHPDLLAAAQRPFASPGLAAPWHGLPGNHDVLLQGELPPSPRTDAIATGRRLVTSLDPRARLPRTATTAEAVDALIGAAPGGRSIAVPADPARRAATAGELRAALARGRATRGPDRLDYEAGAGPVRFVLLDLVAREGGQAPAVAPGQLAWLRARLAAAADAGRRVVLVTHQPPPEAVLAVLHGAGATVVAALHGDRHRNRITPRGRFWIVGTASLADWPMQARLFRLRETAGGGLVLETWMVDQDGRGLAGTARELAFLDAQGGRPRGLAGARADRNARLHLPRAGPSP